MRISIAQTKPIKGDFEENLKVHVSFIKTAIEEKAHLIMFPELSLTGYEPELARQLATTKDDTRLDQFQELSDTENIIICVGLPTKSHNDAIFISMIIFQPNKDRNQLFKTIPISNGKRNFYGRTKSACNSLRQRQQHRTGNLLRIIEHGTPRKRSKKQGEYLYGKRFEFGRR